MAIELRGPSWCISCRKEVTKVLRKEGGGWPNSLCFCPVVWAGWKEGSPPLKLGREWRKESPTVGGGRNGGRKGAQPHPYPNEFTIQLVRSTGYPNINLYSTPEFDERKGRLRACNRWGDRYLLAGPVLSDPAHPTPIHDPAHPTPIRRKLGRNTESPSLSPGVKAGVVGLTVI